MNKENKLKGGATVIVDREFIEKFADSITDILCCDNCQKIVSVSIGSIRWYRDGFFQCGNIKGRLANWCSDECEKQ